jgi:hypothetical protein
MYQQTAPMMIPDRCGTVPRHAPATAQVSEVAADRVLHMRLTVPLGLNTAAQAPCSPSLCPSTGNPGPTRALPGLGGQRGGRQ